MNNQIIVLIKKSWHNHLLTWLLIISSLILFFCSSLRHYLFQSNALDLALFDQWIYLTSQGLPPISSFFGFHMIGDHAAFILYFIAILYKIYPHVYWLFIIQAIALSLGSLPIFALSKQIGLSTDYAKTIVICYLLYPALFNINFFTDFRPEAMAIPCFLWAIWAAIERKTGQFILAIILVLSCKEILSLNIIALGIWLLLIQKRKIYGFLSILIGTFWYLITIGYLVPMLRQGQAGGVVFFASLGNSPSEIIFNILQNPSLIINKFFLPDTLFYYFLLILPVIFGLHWRQALIIIPALPSFLLNIISDYFAQRDLVHHYSLIIFPLIIVWLSHSIYYYQQNHQRKWLNRKFLITWSIIAFLLLGKYEFFVNRYLSSVPYLSSLYNAVELVTTKESVLTTSRVAPHLSHREIIKLTNVNLENTQIKPEDFKYILLDQNQNKNEFDPNLINDLKNKSSFDLIYDQDNIFLFVKK